MKKSISLLLLFIALAFTLSLSSCRETKKDKAEDAIEEVTDGVEEAADEVGDAVEEVGEEVEDATDDH